VSSKVFGGVYEWTIVAWMLVCGQAPVIPRHATAVKTASNRVKFTSTPAQALFDVVSPFRADSMQTIVARPPGKVLVLDQRYAMF
jgi:hypothetical protein